VPQLNVQKLADRVVVADLELRRLAAVFLVLGNLAERDELEDPVVGAYARAPEITVCGPIRLPGPILTCGPMIAYGPISTPSAISAPG
jgi:hypothetical protein